MQRARESTSTSLAQEMGSTMRKVELQVNHGFEESFRLTKFSGIKET